ncbi:MAG: DMT family transporter [Asgard group archaeon]|nr:DMT family transporter [Asgard group archaeon]
MPEKTATLGQRLLADFGLLLITLIWGSSFVMVDKAVAVVNVFIFLAFRFSIAFVLLLLIFAYRFIKFGIEWKEIWRGVLVGLFLFIGYSFQTFGLQLGTDPGKAAFITGLSVVLVPIFSALLLKKTPHKLSWLGILIAVIGLGLLSIVNLQLDFAAIKGDLLVLVCAFGFAFQIIFIDRSIEKIHFSTLATSQIGTTAILSWIASAIFWDDNFSFTHSYFTNQVIFALLFTGTLVTAFILSVQSYIQKKTSPTHVAIIFATEPVFGAIFAVILVHEHFLPRQWGGCVLILAAMIFQQLIDIYFVQKQIPTVTSDQKGEDAANVLRSQNHTLNDSN